MPRSRFIPFLGFKIWVKVMVRDRVRVCGISVRQHNITLPLIIHPRISEFYTVPSPAILQFNNHGKFNNHFYPKKSKKMRVLCTDGGKSNRRF